MSTWDLDYIIIWQHEYIGTYPYRAYCSETEPCTPPKPIQTILWTQIAEECTCFQVSISTRSKVMSHLGRPILEPHPRAMDGGQGLCDHQISAL